MREPIDLQELADLIAGGYWLNTSDSGEICPKCAEENADRLIASTENALGDGFCVVAMCSGGEATCDLCGDSADLDIDTP